MFLLAGISEKIKAIGDVPNTICPLCERLSRLTVYKKYSYFHLFFVPLFRWNTTYFVQTMCCSGRFTVDKDAAKAYENGDEGPLAQSLRDMPVSAASKAGCPHCGGEVQQAFSYCPYCGGRI